MKNSIKILMGLIIVVAFLAGFFIGNSVKAPVADSSNLAGTIGKMKNTDKFKMKNTDKGLRSKLLSDEALLKDFQQYYTYQQITCVKLCEDLDFSIMVSENENLFKKEFAMAIEKIKQYRQTLDQTNKDLLLAINTLQQLSEVDEAKLAEVLKNANLAVSQVKYKQADILTFVDSIEKFLMGNNPYLFPDLIKAHDVLSVNQLIINV